VRGADALAEMMLQITGYVMRYAPIAVFGAIANVVAASGPRDPCTYVELLIEFYLSLLLLWTILLTIGALFLGRRIFTLIRYIRQPLMIAFSTAAARRRCPRCSSSSTGSAYRAGFRASSCRWATRSTSTAR
jgi:Na+/H+-dicarboxylate symporter